MDRSKENVFGILKGGITGYFGNLNLSLPFLFLIVIALVLAFIFSSAAGDSIQNLQVNPSNALWIVLIMLIFFIILILAYSFMISGAIGMAIEVAKKKKATFSTLMSFGSKFWSRFLGVTILLLLVTLIPFILLVTGADVLVRNLSVASQLVTLIFIIFIVLLLFIFFMLAPYFLVIKNIRVFAAIQESIKFAKRYYGDLLLLTLIFVIAETILYFAGFIGQIINLLVIAPIQALIFTLFITTKKK